MQKTSGPGRGRRSSLLFEGAEFSELTRDVPAQNPSAFSSFKALSGFSQSFSLKRSNSDGKVLNAFSRLPPQDQWLRSGIVERQTVSSDMVWLPRLMILTEQDLLFAKEGTDIVLDRLALNNITFIGKVLAFRGSISTPFANHASLRSIVHRTHCQVV